MPRTEASDLKDSSEDQGYGELTRISCVSKYLRLSCDGDSETFR